MYQLKHQTWMPTANAGPVTALSCPTAVHMHSHPRLWRPRWWQESPLLLTDPRDAEAQRMLSVSHHMVIKPFLLLDLAAEYRTRWWMWSTVVWRPSEVHDTHRRTKLTAPETISHSRDVENRRLTVWAYPTSIWRPRWEWPRWNFA